MVSLALCIHCYIRLTLLAYTTSFRVQKAVESRKFLGFLVLSRQEVLNTAPIPTFSLTLLLELRIRGYLLLSNQRNASEARPAARFVHQISAQPSHVVPTQTLLLPPNSAFVPPDLFLSRSPPNPFDANVID